MASEAHRLLGRAMHDLASDRLFGVEFTTEARPGVGFRGRLARADRSNALGVGGFEPSADATLLIEPSEFERENLIPLTGMPVWVKGRPYLVATIGEAEHLITLNLNVAHPKVSDLPEE